MKMDRPYVNIGVCQLKQGYDIKDNLYRALAMVDQAKALEAKVVVLPEIFISPYEPESIQSAVHFTREALDEMQKAAKKNQIYLIAGSLPYETGMGMPFNRAIVFDPQGARIFQHDKIHLFDCNPPGGPAVKESQIVKAGNTIGSFDTPWGTASVIVCYDIRFTPLIQLLADRGVSLLFVPATFSLSTGRAHWEMLVRMRALELQGFVIGVQPAFNPDLKYVPYGHSMIAGPWGNKLLDAGQGEAVNVVRLDLNEIEKIKSRFSLLSHRRNDLYSIIWRKQE